MSGWVSPRLGVRFELTEEGLRVISTRWTKVSLLFGIGAARELAVQRAEQEAQRAERLAAKLRELNIDPDSI
jgi:hypothetical protein